MPHGTRRRMLSLAVPLVTCLALTVGTVSAVAADVDQPVPGPALNDDTAAVPALGLIVRLDDADADLADVARQAEAELPGDVTVAETATGPGGLGLLSFDEQVDASDLDDAIDELQSDPAVDWAVPNGMRFPSATANDPLYNDARDLQWNLKGTWGVRANTAWDVTTGSAGVRVAVVDTGVLTSHPDLAGQTVAGRDFVDDEYRCLNRSCSKVKYRKSYVNANDGNSWDTNASDPGDWRGSSTCDAQAAKPSSWHGTHVAGIIAAKRNNGKGIAGIAPGLKVQPVRVMGRCGGSDWDIAMGVLWAAGVNVRKYDKRHASVTVNKTPSKVVNLSLGAYEPSLKAARQACRFYSSIGSLARSRGVTLVAATGNQGDDHRLNVPSSCAGFIAVGATTKDGRPAFYSNHGAGVDIAAPGGDSLQPDPGDIASTWNSSTTRPGTNGYGWMSGTSMAAPAVSAVAGLAYSLGITNPAVVERVLKATATTSSCTAAYCGAGIVNARGVVTAKAPTSSPRLSGSPRPGGTLTATTGAWRPAGTTAQLTWYRGSTVRGTGPTYAVSAADLGHTISVRATAIGGTAAIYSSVSTVVKAKSAVRFSMPKRFKASQRARIKIKVTAPYVRATGTVRVYDGKKRIATKKITSASGVVRITLPKIKRHGKHRMRVVYSGNAKLTSAKSVSKIVRVR